MLELHMLCNAYAEDNKQQNTLCHDESLSTIRYVSELQYEGVSRSFQTESIMTYSLQQ